MTIYIDDTISFDYPFEQLKVNLENLFQQFLKNLREVKCLKLKIIGPVYEDECIKLKSDEEYQKLESLYLEELQKFFIKVEIFL